jgi:hypothetical protein
VYVYFYGCALHYAKLLESGKLSIQLFNNYRFLTSSYSRQKQENNMIPRGRFGISNIEHVSAKYTAKYTLNIKNKNLDRFLQKINRIAGLSVLTLVMIVFPLLYMPMSIRKTKILSSDTY